MEKIIVKNITDRQKLTIKNGINTYLYIQNHHEQDSEDFRNVYYDFYLKARSSVFAKKKTNTEKKEKEDNPNWDKYFKLLNDSKGEEPLISIVKNIESFTGSYEFSFASKLLHTKNTSVPIYDSKVRDYLKKVEKVKLVSLDVTVKNEEDKEDKRKKKIDKINNNWKELNKWYDEFFESGRAKEWLDWFDDNFPEGKSISDVKKIDFIIFACTS